MYACAMWCILQERVDEAPEEEEAQMEEEEEEVRAAGILTQQVAACMLASKMHEGKRGVSMHVRSGL